MVEKKEEFWRNKQNGDFPGKNVFKKGLLTFFSKHLLSGKCFKNRFLTKKPICGEKIEKPSFLLAKAIDVLKKNIYKGYEKLQKFLLFFFNKSYRVFRQSFIKQKSILLFSVRIEFSKQTKFY